MKLWELKIDDYQQLKEDVHLIRESVFVCEQNINRAIEFDHQDTYCTHVVLYHQKKAVGTGRINSIGKIGRVCVLKEYRGKQYGKALMKALEGHGKDNDCDQVHLHAQEGVIPFYEKIGYGKEGSIFAEAGISHQRMAKKF